MREKQRSRMRGGGLSAQEGRLVRSCMFGSIQFVHVVNMKASILFTLRQSRLNGELGELLPIQHIDTDGT